MKLNASGNKIKTLSNFPVLLALKELNLNNNLIGMCIELPKLNILRNIENLSIIENPIAKSKGDEQII